ncbi:hypothetical protein GCM10020331_097310 [Ectobacillus funiculus]
MLLVSLVVILASFMAACSSTFTSGSGDKKGKIVIGAAMPTFDDKWMSYLYDAMKATAKENDVELKMVDAKK